ncbi:GOLPH3/VPS74 family protein [Allokutzneria oryzae]|uniref:GPP34 family phosphoprotein n=1 Tax=Allokutzneria oryzae TaxID=1378989 RepID=A0ABV6A5D7_9PSEU
MDLPESLPARLFLLAFDQDRGRLTAGGRLAPLLRAGALTELYLSGRLANAKGRAQVAAGDATGDPVLDQVLALVSSTRPRPWRHWVSRQPKTTRVAVQDALAASGHIGVTRHRLLGIFPTTTVTLLDPRGAMHVSSLASEALRGASPAADVDLADAAVVCLAAAANLRSVVSRSDRRVYRRRLAELAGRVGPVPAALRKALQEQSGSMPGEGD